MSNKKKYILRKDQYLFGQLIPKGTQFYSKDKDDTIFGACGYDGLCLPFLSSVHSSWILNNSTFFHEVDDRVCVSEIENTTTGISIKCDYAISYIAKETLRANIESLLNGEFNRDTDSRIELLNKDRERLDILLDKYSIPRKNGDNRLSMIGRVNLLIESLMK